MSRSWRQPPPEGRLFRKPQYEPEMEQDLDPEEIYIVVNEWPSATDADTYLDEPIAYKRSRDSAWLVLQSLAEAHGVPLSHNDTSFEKDDETWYITTGILED